MKIEMSERQLEIHQSALAAWERTLSNLDAARESGIVPACFTAKVGALRDAQDELARFRKLVADAQPRKVRTAPEADTQDLPMRLHSVLEAAVDALILRAPMILIGPPGIGKTMLARRLAAVMPEPTDAECIAMTEMYRAAGILEDDVEWRGRPFRAPHHSCSAAAMVGAPQPHRRRRPGEVQLARHGVLFLDELPEFSAQAIKAIAGAGLLDNVQVVASAMPCACGWAGGARRQCACTDGSLQRYRQRLDRMCDALKISVRIHMPSIVGEDLINDNRRCHPTSAYRLRVTRAWSN